MFLHKIGKAPPNLPPGVPPLLPNPYIVAPGLLHHYPVSFLLCGLSYAHSVLMSVFCHVFIISQTSFLQPQMYGYDDLQVLQTRIPLVSIHRRGYMSRLCID